LHAQSVLWLAIWRNVGMIDSWDCCYHFLLVEGWGVNIRWWPRLSTVPSWCGVTGEASIRLQSPSSRPSNPLPRIVDQMARLRAAGDRRECPLICCVMQPVNSCWTCSDGCNIGGYNSSRYDSIRYTQYRFRYDTDPKIGRSLVTDSPDQKCLKKYVEEHFLQKKNSRETMLRNISCKKNSRETKTKDHTTNSVS